MVNQLWIHFAKWICLNLKIIVMEYYDQKIKDEAICIKFYSGSSDWAKCSGPRSKKPCLIELPVRPPSAHEKITLRPYFPPLRIYLLRASRLLEKIHPKFQQQQSHPSWKRALSNFWTGPKNTSTGAFFRKNNTTTYANESRGFWRLSGRGKGEHG